MYLLKSVLGDWDSLVEVFPPLTPDQVRESLPVVAKEVYQDGARKGILIYREGMLQEIITPVPSHQFYTFSAAEAGELEACMDDLGYDELEQLLLSNNSTIYPSYEMAVRAAIAEMKTLWDETQEYEDESNHRFPKTFDNIEIKDEGHGVYFCEAMGFRFAIHTVTFKGDVPEIPGVKFVGTE